MKERPILFSAPMARAILAGQKTQTRRVVKLPRGASWSDRLGGTVDGFFFDDDGLRARGIEELCCPYGAPGDVLWVRETWRAEELPTGEDGVRFAADEAFVRIADTSKAADLWCEAYENGKHGTNWRPSIHMSRWAARLFLRVTAIRCERIQDITEEDAVAEGTREPSVAQVIGGGDVTERRVFARLWCATYGASSWERNEWVWALTFERCADPSPRAGKVAP